MLISCEKCATTYVLDERLIPAAGAPVQCTRCSHVFIAKPGGTDQAPTPPPAPAGPQPNQTIQFGAVGAASVPTHQTMMFGAAKTPPAAAPTNQTMMFGAANAGPTPAPPAAPANSTMMFGAIRTPGGAASAGPVPAAPPARAQANQTMMFGAANAGPVPATGAPAPRPNATMMFGAAGSIPPPAAAASGPVPKPPAPQSHTMIFGAPGGPAAPAPAPVPVPARPAPAPAGQSQSNRTMMFGIPTADKPNAAEARTDKTTMMFGASEALNNPGKLTEQTVRISTEELERMKREHGGRGSETTPPETESVGPAHHQRTQMFAMSDIANPDATPQEGRDALAPPAETREQVEARHQKTAMFAMSPEAPQARRPAPSLDEPGSQERSNVKFDPSLLETFPPDGGAVAPPPNRATMIFGGPGSTPGSLATPRPQVPDPSLMQTTSPDLVRTTMPNLPPLDGAPELPPESERALAPVSDASLDPAFALQKQVKSRNRIALGVVFVAVLAAAGLFGWKVVAPKYFGHQVPLEVMQGVENSLSELRKDDTVSKTNAVKTLTAIVKAQPGFVDAHAALVTALTLQLDDLQQRAKRLEKAAEERNLRIGKYNQDKGAGWEAKAKVLLGEVEALKKDYDPLVATARELETRLRDAYKAMQVAAQQGGQLNRQGELALIRAQALFHAYGGTDEALKLSKRYTDKSEGVTDGSMNLVDAEYAANTRASPELIQTAQAALTALHERDPTFFRTYILAARLDLQSKLYDEAEAELERVTAMKPKHDIAVELIEWVKKAKAEKVDKEKPASP